MSLFPSARVCPGKFWNCACQARGTGEHAQGGKQGLSPTKSPLQGLRQEQAEAQET